MAEYIDRQAAKLAIVEEGQRSKRYKIGEFWELNRDEAWDAIDSVPSADVEPVRHGRWMEIVEANEQGEPYQAGVLCSECRKAFVFEPNYCPNCGARMDGDANAE